MEESEYEHTKVSKKGRHRKKFLYNSILRLMEFYFSDSNLTKDRFLSQLINEDPFIDLNIFLKFNKIKKLNCTIDDIRKAISKSDLIELSENKEKVKRKTPVKVKENVDLCTVYVENIPADANHEWISNIFTDFGNVVYVSIPKYKHNKTNKGFAFVEFEDEQAAKNALEYFESIGCKMPSETNPENLKSIQTFEDEKQPIKETPKEETELLNVEASNIDEQKEEKENLKRELEEKPESASKKIKLDVENVETDDMDTKKKKKHKKDKKKNLIKDLGLQVLLKPEWKKMRNRYLDLQKKQMKEFKKFLHKQKYPQKHFDKSKGNYTQENAQNIVEKEEPTKLEYIEGVIVKLKPTEPINDAKKIKSELKSYSPGIEYVDVGSEDIFIRFSDNQSAKNFCMKEFSGEKTVLEGPEEQKYWEKIQNDRNVKFSRNIQKQRGRDKLLKKAEKLMAKHIKFDEAE